VEGLYDIIAGECLLNEPLSRYTSMGVGGPADIMVLPRTIRDISLTLEYCKDLSINLSVIGAGTNIIVRDGGIRGIVLRIASPLTKMSVYDETLVGVSAGTTLRDLASTCADHGLSGLEFTSGIPGTVGGALYMNAGTDLGSFGELVREVVVLDCVRKRILRKEDLRLGYRTSRFHETREVILEVVLRLTRDSPSRIRNRMNQIIKKRKQRQPLTAKSAGCIFKNPTGLSAGRLIDQAGCKGLRIGGAEVSTKHANFIINNGNATAEDVLRLMKEIERRVYDHFGIRLSPEVIILGEEKSADGS